MKTWEWLNETAKEPQDFEEMLKGIRDWLNSEHK